MVKRKEVSDMLWVAAIGLAGLNLLDGGHRLGWW